MAEKRERALNFRCSETEEQEFREAADMVDMSISSFLRLAAKLGAAQLACCPELRRMEIKHVPCAGKSQ
ncbi:plasmid mobilization protein [Desulfovibrio sp. SGI.169]|uniref:plasmid mobilization protein n=1 Tax=Desulfovibrio sp. SGI.169 TaxID=3420561 RepID=UPI003CFD53CB